MNFSKSQGFKILFLLWIVYGSSILLAYDTQTIYAQNDNISQDLNLDAVASIFGLSSDLEDFEYRLNDPEAQISNLDINEDGYVDYLRVLETARGSTRRILIEAVLDQDVYQDVATIIVERDSYQHTTVEIVGDSYIYGSDYIVEPAYSYTPIIYTYFWSRGYYRTYRSRYSWGYYPKRYRRWRPHPTPYYHKHIYDHIDRKNHYRYRGKRGGYRGGYGDRTKAYMRFQNSNYKKRGGTHNHPELYKTNSNRVANGSRSKGYSKASTGSRSVKYNRVTNSRTTKRYNTTNRQNSSNRYNRASTNRTTKRYNATTTSSKGYSRATTNRRSGGSSTTTKSRTTHRYNRTTTSSRSQRYNRTTRGTTTSSSYGRVSNQRSNIRKNSTKSYNDRQNRPTKRHNSRSSNRHSNSSKYRNNQNIDK